MLRVVVLLIILVAVVCFVVVVAVVVVVIVVIVLVFCLLHRCIPLAIRLARATRQKLAVGLQSDA